MTVETTESPGESKDFAWLLAEWNNSLKGAIEGMGVPRCGVRAISANDAKKGSTSFWWEQHFGPAPDICIRIGISDPFWKLIGESAVTAIGLDGPSNDDIRSAFLEILTQSLSGLATSLTGRCGEEITCLPGRETSDQSAPGVPGFVSVTIGDDNAAEACVVVSPQLLRKISLEKSRDNVSAEPRGDEIAAGGTSPVSGAFDSVLDVEMPISVSFGVARRSLEDLLKLQPGSSVRLGRDVCDPVTLQVNGRLVAMGEVIVVRGQYALRIQKLSSLNDRLQQLSAIVSPSFRRE